MRDGDQIRPASLEGHSGGYLETGLEVQGEMLTCQSQGDPRGADWGKVETGRSGQVLVQSGDQTGTGEGLDAGCGGYGEAWTLAPRAHNWLEEGPFTNTGDAGGGSGRGWRRQ